MNNKWRKSLTVMAFGLSLIGLILSIVFYKYWWEVTVWLIACGLWTWNLSEL